jgi:hypothetical protein
LLVFYLPPSALLYRLPGDREAGVAGIIPEAHLYGGDLLHHRGAFLLEGRVEQAPDKRFSFLVERIEDLREVLTRAGVTSPPRATAAFAGGSLTNGIGDTDDRTVVAR